MTSRTRSSILQDTWCKTKTFQLEELREKRKCQTTTVVVLSTPIFRTLFNVTVLELRLVYKWWLKLETQGVFFSFCIRWKKLLIYSENSHKFFREGGNLPFTMGKWWRSKILRQKKRMWKLLKFLYKKRDYIKSNNTSLLNISIFNHCKRRSTIKFW